MIPRLPEWFGTAPPTEFLKLVPLAGGAAAGGDRAGRCAAVGPILPFLAIMQCVFGREAALASLFAEFAVESTPNGLVPDVSNPPHVPKRVAAQRDVSGSSGDRGDPSLDRRTGGTLRCR